MRRLSNRRKIDFVISFLVGSLGIYFFLINAIWLSLFATCVTLFFLFPALRITMKEIDIPEESKEKRQKIAFEKIKNDVGQFIYDEDSFIIPISSNQEKILWKNITAIFVYKVDLFTFDEIRADIFYEGGSFMISEETPGWYVFFEKLNTEFPQIDKDWFGNLVFPAFKTNLTLLYERDGKAFDMAVSTYYK